MVQGVMLYCFSNELYRCTAVPLCQGARERNLPLLVDGCGLTIVADNPDAVRGERACVHAYVLDGSNYSSTAQQQYNALVRQYSWRTPMPCGVNVCVNVLDDSSTAQQQYNALVNEYSRRTPTLCLVSARVCAVVCVSVCVCLCAVVCVCVCVSV